tara:strand:+ start:5317 stop:6936 length:1620 start_codon:yes stop_codon:yes gene_type:complete
VKASIWTIILPRLEVSFLEEWIKHHLSLGFDKIYIYDNGTSFDENIGGDVLLGKSAVIPYYNVKPVEKENAGIVWEKKPYADYLLHLTDDEVYDKLNYIIQKYRGNVELINWRYGKEINVSYPFSQGLGYKHCVENNKSDWWITIDPDEYIILHKHENIKSFLENHPCKHRLLIEQRIFDKRVIGKPVREIYNWAYKDGYTKTLVQKPYFWTHLDNFKKSILYDKNCVFYDVHETYSEFGMNTHYFNLDRLIKKGYGISKNKSFVYKGTDYKEIVWNSNRFVMDEREIELFHYRGSPTEIGTNLNAVHEQYQFYNFDKIDKSMEKYLNDNEYNEWKFIHQPFELNYHKKPNYRWETFKYHWRWDDCWDKLFGSFMGFNKNQFKDSDMILDIGCGSRPALNWFTSGNKYYLDSLLDEYKKIPEMKRHWDTYPKENLLNMEAEVLLKHLVGKFSFIMCWNVLDHTYNWKTIIKNISMYLKDGGIALIGNDIHEPTIGHPGVESKESFYGEIKKYFNIERDENQISLDDMLYRDVCLKLYKR